MEKKKIVILKIAVTVLLLGAVACVLFGSNYIIFGELVFSHRYITALFPEEGTTWRPWFVIYVRMVFLCAAAGAGLIWVKKPWAALASAVVCLCPTVFYVIHNILDHYSPFAIDGGLYAGLMFYLPVVAAILGLVMFVKARGGIESTTTGKEEKEA